MQTHSRAQPVVRFETAQSLMSAAIRHARENGWNIAVAILDPAGQTVTAGRMDGVPPSILDFAVDKAFTATLGKATEAFADRMASSSSLTLGLSNRPRLCAWEGGKPIYEDGILIGAIGVSGAAGEEDRECAETAVAGLGLSTR